MGKYCKAYQLRRFREYKQWVENFEITADDGKADSNDTQSDLQSSDDIPLYLQENYAVTRGIYIDEDIVFDKITPEWVSFCKESLKFEVPNYDLPD